MTVLYTNNCIKLRTSTRFQQTFRNFQVPKINAKSRFGSSNIFARRLGFSPTNKAGRSVLNERELLMARGVSTLT